MPNSDMNKRIEQWSEAPEKEAPAWVGWLAVLVIWLVIIFFFWRIGGFNAV
jgi:hypothetical protein